GIIMPPVFKWAERGIYKLNYRIMSRYNECWIPDHAGEKNLSGVLSHKYRMPAHSIFIGPLSRFHITDGLEMKYDLLVVLSGPEPQRTILEQKIISQLKSFSFHTLIIRGTPGEKNIFSVSQNIEIKNHLTADELNKAMLQSKMIVSRSGYSTIMDLAATGRKAILIPTPGQTEQEYLGKYFYEKKIFYSVSQSDFDLQKALIDSQNFTGLQLKNNSDTLSRTIKNFLEKIK
ncbi:MAG TPA: glycosyltransferase, partial [Bacteroidetes bacterium]|nr:glycosyltransferase [Bacteroidota bacterium]